MGRILVVDDDSIIRLSLEKVLHKLCPGCHVQLAASGAEALELLATGPVDLILSDHSMPTMTGLDFFQRIKGKYPGAKRLLITAYPLSELNQTQVADAELDGFLAKPFQLSDIKDLIDEFLS